MSKFVLVLGIINTERDMFGGIFDVEKTPLTGDETLLLEAINRALKLKTPGSIGSTEADREVCGEVNYEKMPFTNTIEDEVLIYVD